MRQLCDQVNVVAILMREGQLEDGVRRSRGTVVWADEVTNSRAGRGRRLAPRLAEIYRPLYVIANSVETRVLAPALADEGVPVVALVHEFSGYTKPAGVPRTTLRKSGGNRLSGRYCTAFIGNRLSLPQAATYSVLSQGSSKVPRSERSTDDEKRARRSVRSGTDCDPTERRTTCSSSVWASSTGEKG